ncbi:MAG TPA: hypothetical protein VHY35_02285 [Stellaceae bacterium]|jgi:hypothetical protein|nr:hypothetical protein [Stellaceae bacterium]
MAAVVFTGFLLVIIVTGKTTEILPMETYNSMQMCEEAAGASAFYDSRAKKWDQATQHDIQFVCIPTTRESSAPKADGDRQP